MNFFKNNGLALLALAIGIASLVHSMTHKQPKIAYAETPILLSEFNEAIKARLSYEEEKKNWDKNFKLLNDSMQAAMNKMKAEYEKATPEQRHAMSQNLEKWNSDLQRYSQAVKSMSQEKEKKLMEPVVNKMNSYMKIWGEEHGYDLILGTMTGGNILQANSSLNVTSKLLTDLNKHYKDLPSPEKQKEVNPVTSTETGSHSNSTSKDTELVNKREDNGK